LKKKYRDSNQSLADEYISYAMSLNLSGKQDTALNYLNKAESITLKEKHNERDLFYLYSSYASCYKERRIQSSSLNDFQAKKRSNLETALIYYKKALYCLNEAKDKTDITLQKLKYSNFPIPDLEILLYMGKAYQQLASVLSGESKEKKIEYLTEAYFYSGTGSDFAEYLRTTLISESSKLQFTDLQKEIFTVGVQVAYELYTLTGDITWAEKALQNTERKKAVSLYDQLSEMQSRSVSLIPDSLNQKETRFSTNLSYLRERLQKGLTSDVPDSARIFQIRARIFETEQELHKLRGYLEEHFPEYYQTKYEQKPLTFKDIQTKIKPGEVVLSYSLNLPDSSKEGSLYIFEVSEKNCHLIRQPVTNQTVEDIRTVFSQISSNQFLRSGVKEFAGFCESSYRLYRLLVEPFRETIREKRLTVIPDGLLCYIPFEALLTDKCDTGTIHFYDLPYLVLDYPVSYSYSARLLYYKPSKHIPFRTRALAFSPAYPADYIVDNDTVHLSAIPGIYEEVNNLRRKIRTASYSGEKATEENFREQSGKYDILHLAMHTLINDSLPMLSRLAFTQGNRDSLNNDGWLTTSDIYYLHLRAKMVVLSACKSGSGNLKSGEGIMSLARGFFYAGCPSALMSLWDVEDMSASRIMKSFYTNLKRGKTKDRALQEAKIAFLKKADPLSSHPHFWLGMIMIGNPEPLFHGVGKNIVIILALLLGILTIDLVRKKTSR
jgi:CHAT domain-containing protein